MPIMHSFPSIILLLEYSGTWVPNRGTYPLFGGWLTSMVDCSLIKCPCIVQNRGEGVGVLIQR